MSTKERPTQIAKIHFRDDDAAADEKQEKKRSRVTQYEEDEDDGDDQSARSEDEEYDEEADAVETKKAPAKKRGFPLWGIALIAVTFIGFVGTCGYIVVKNKRANSRDAEQVSMAPNQSGLQQPQIEVAPAQQPQIPQQQMQQQIQQQQPMPQVAQPAPQPNMSAQVSVPPQVQAPVQMQVVAPVNLVQQPNQQPNQRTAVVAEAPPAQDVPTAAPALALQGVATPNIATLSAKDQAAIADTAKSLNDLSKLVADLKKKFETLEGNVAQLQKAQSSQLATLQSAQKAPQQKPSQQKPQQTQNVAKAVPVRRPIVATATPAAATAPVTVESGSSQTQTVITEVPQTPPPTVAPSYKISVIVGGVAFISKKTSDGNDSEISVSVGDRVDGRAVTQIDAANKQVVLEGGQRISAGR